MTNDTIDLSLALRGDITVTPEVHPDDRAQKLRIESRQALFEDIQRMVVFVVILVALIIIGAVAGYIGIVSSKAPSDAQQWCRNVLSAVVTGGISFVLGKNSRTK